MTAPDAAPTLRAKDECTFTFDDRHWRVRGLDEERSCQRLRVALLVSRRELVHVDTLDLYAARQRQTFLRQAAAELYCDEATIKQDLGRVLLAAEARHEALLRQTFTPPPPDVPPMTDRQRREALALLRDPRLTDRILADYETCGLVGEETNKLICYLACASRLLPQPLAVLVQSSSAAGKTTLVESTLRLMPPETQQRLSALTGQSLFYMGRTELKHRILAVAEEQGAAEACYGLKLLQSDRRLRIACVGKDSGTGRPQTQHYEVEGPVALLLTTTAQEPDEELANRCLTVSVNECPRQTAAIQHRQRLAYLPADSSRSAQADREQAAVEQRHQHAQRLLEPLPVVIPFAERLTFRSDQVRYRRDHAKYLSLIAAAALLHQHQRRRVSRGGRPAVQATLEDLELANRLLGSTLGSRPGDLLPQTRQLLGDLDRYVTRRAAEQAVSRDQLRFTQRELREALGWSDHALRRQLARLVQLEYLLVYRTGRGNQRAYQLLYHGQASDGAPLPLGLTDVARLRRQLPRGV